MPNDLAPSTTLGGFDALPHAGWQDIAAVLPLPWPAAAVDHDLRWHAAEHAIDPDALPSMRELAARWGWSPASVHRRVTTASWMDLHNPIPWRTSVRPRASGFVDGDDGALFELPGPMSHADVVDRAVRWLRGLHQCRVVFAEICTYESVNPDAIGFRFGTVRPWSVLIEAKVSRSDFRADREKIIHRLPDGCPGQERWYLTPPNLVAAHEIPDGWGLAECGKRSVRIVVPAPVLEANIGRARADMGILLSALRRHQIGVEWRHEIARFAPAAVRAIGGPGAPA